MPRLAIQLGLMLLVNLSAWGSGSYLHRPVVPMAHDAGRYELGKAVFLGKTRIAAEIGAASDRARQEKRLNELQDQLPAKVRPGAGLPGLAGRLTADQLSALEYYLHVRYKTK